MTSSLRWRPAPRLAKRLLRKVRALAPNLLPSERAASPSDDDGEASFDAKSYWLRRHRQFAGDPRSVGNMSHTIEVNERGQSRARERLERLLDETRLVVEGTAVLDMGCGIGLLAPSFTARGARYTGVELSPVALREARARCPEGRFTEGDVCSYRSPLRFDVVVTSYVLVHLVRDDEWREALFNLAFAMKDDAVLILIDDMPENDRVETARHVVNRSRREYAAELSHMGLEFIDRKQDSLSRLLAAPQLRNFHLIARTSSTARQ